MLTIIKRAPQVNEGTTFSFMTRINSGIDPSELNNAMLIAEHREIKRIPNAVKSGRFHLEGQPTQFTLGKGHVKFFYDKLAYLRRRYEVIYAECKKRGLNVTYFGTAWEGVPSQFMGEYSPTAEGAEWVRARIRKRMGGGGNAL